MLKRVYDINLNYLGVRSQESGVSREERRNAYEILENSIDNFSIFLVLSVLSLIDN
ncbi:MAG: hypothetical protein F6K25_30765 [Okeania sp. SIO2G4]|uniref:hypothetical protein n=1 Tax=unclassified Okeania TaxID=2634635 RepID=UPI0013C1037C|nr:MULTISPECIES: hypothetical protein [unclassified Okeania]NEP05823.1 hypothetical protein [Okeania sp. SIO4D6]NEP75917.1 hypothetical protein [Okeania sp. SIO2G5]NEQ94779.1 hypothetical protein [Okeania sp. SIO2G4]